MPEPRSGNAVQNRVFYLFAFRDIAVDVLDFDRCVVNENSHRQRQATKGHDVDGLSQRAQDQDEERMESGIETAMISVLRQLPRKIRIISPVRQAAIEASRITPLIEARTKID